MQIPVLIEPVKANGYRVTTGQPLDVTAEGATREEALERLRQVLQARLDSARRLPSLRSQLPNILWRSTLGCSRIILSSTLGSKPSRIIAAKLTRKRKPRELARLGYGHPLAVSTRSFDCLPKPGVLCRPSSPGEEGERDAVIRTRAGIQRQESPGGHERYGSPRRSLPPGRNMDRRAPEPR